MENQRASQSPEAEAPETAPRLLDGWVSRSEVADQLGLKAATLTRWEARRVGPPCVRVGRRVLYRAEAVRAWLKSRESTPIARRAR